MSLGFISYLKRMGKMHTVGEIPFRRLTPRASVTECRLEVEADGDSSERARGDTANAWRSRGIGELR
jgi:hypothetical protein